MRIDLDTDSITTVTAPDTSSYDPYGYWIYDVVPHANLGIGSRELGEGPSLLMVDLDSGVTEVGEPGIINPRYVQGGFLVYQLIDNYGPFVVRAFDAESREFRGPPEDLLTNIYVLGQFVGPDGSYLYVPEMLGLNNSSRHLFFYDLSSSTFEKASWTGDDGPQRPAYSPDGLSVAVDFNGGGSAPQFVSEYDLETDIFTTRTFGDANRRDPDWSANGSFLYYDGFGSESPGIYRQSIGISSSEDHVVEGNASSPNLSRDGKWLSFLRDRDLFLYNLESETESVLDSAPGTQRYPDFSPDSKYIAFEVAEGGSFRADVRSVDGTSSYTLGYPQARLPKWAPDGNSMYFLVRGDGIYNVPVTTDPSFEVRGEAKKIVGLRSAVGTVFFDISPDGNTLAISATSIDANLQGEQKNYSTLMWWRNWAQSLSKE